MSDTVPVHSLDQAEALLKKAGALEEPLSQALLIAFRAGEASARSAAVAAASRHNETKRLVMFAGVFLAVVLLGATTYLAGEVRGAAAAHAKDVAAAYALIEKDAQAHTRDLERSVTAASDAAKRAEQAAAGMESSAAEMRRLVGVVQERIDRLPKG